MHAGIRGDLFGIISCQNGITLPPKLLFANPAVSPSFENDVSVSCQNGITLRTPSGPRQDPVRTASGPRQDRSGPRPAGKLVPNRGDSFLLCALQQASASSASWPAFQPPSPPSLDAHPSSPPPRSRLRLLQPLACTTASHTPRRRAWIRERRAADHTPLLPRAGVPGAYPTLPQRLCAPARRFPDRPTATEHRCETKCVCAQPSGAASTTHTHHPSPLCP